MGSDSFEKQIGSVLKVLSVLTVQRRVRGLVTYRPLLGGADLGEAPPTQQLRQGSQNLLGRVLRKFVTTIWVLHTFLFVLQRPDNPDEITIRVSGACLKHPLAAVPVVGLYPLLCI